MSNATPRTPEDPAHRAGNAPATNQPPSIPAWRWPAIWIRTVARSWRSGLHDLNSRIP